MFDFVVLSWNFFPYLKKKKKNKKLRSSTHKFTRMVIGPWSFYFFRIVIVGFKKQNSKVFTIQNFKSKPNIRLDWIGLDCNPW